MCAGLKARAIAALESGATKSAIYGEALSSVIPCCLRGGGDAVGLRRQLSLLNTAKNANRMNVPGWELHPLKGALADHWSIKVNGNWRMTFTFENENAILADYQDYH